MIEIKNAPPEDKKRFDCSTCKEFVQKKRRCEDVREDFTYKDDKTTFPIQVTQGGTPWDFCPGKATWGGFYQNLYNTLVVARETGTQWEPGPVSAQPQWWLELLAWFIPVYDDFKFYSRAKSILGDGKSKAKTPDAAGKAIARAKKGGATGGRNQE